MRLSIFPILLLLSPQFLLAQASSKGSIEGKLVDKQSRQPLQQASVSLHSLKDSSVLELVLTDQKGVFFISPVAKGSYRLQISYLGYKNLYYPITISEQQPLQNLGTLQMEKQEVSLNEVVIKQQVPPVALKKDTLEFDAGAFKVRENAVVEDLLKKLPGVTVDKDGTVTAQGETVQKVLVDGKPFFSDDPKIALQNLPADIVDKIQLLDKKSDQAEFSKIDDGNTQKAINLTIKKDKKKGVFGRISAGTGNHERFANNVSLNQFKNDQQLSFIGSANNVNNLGFTFQDIMNFNGGGGRGGGNRAGSGNYQVSITPGAINLNGLSIGGGGSGITTTYSGGLNYRDTWTKNLKVNGSYFYNNINTSLQQLSSRQYFLKDTSYFYDQNTRSARNNDNHRFNFNMEYEIDSMNSLIFTPTISYTHSTYESNSTYRSLTNGKAPVNSGGNNYYTDLISPTLSANLLYRHRFSKPGRTFSANVYGSYTQSNSKGTQQSINQFFKPNNASFADTLQQENMQQSEGKTVTSRLTYTEPVSGSRFLEFTYANSWNFNASDKSTYDYNKATGQYDLLNKRYSNSFENTYLSNQAGINLRTQKPKYEYTLGLNVQQNNLTSYSVTKDTTFKQQTVNFYPVAFFNYTFSRNKRLRFIYRGNTRQPSLSQLQPVPDNSNPLNVKLGNPDLKPEFSNNLTLNYNTFNFASFKSFFAFVNFSTTNNKIVNASTLNSFGQQTSKSVNTNGTYNLNGFLSFGWPLKKNRSNINSNTNFSLGKEVSFINGAENFTHSFSAKQGVSINYNYKELFDISTGGYLNYNMANYSLQPNLNTNYYSYNYSLDLNVNLPKGFIIGSDFNYTKNTGRSEGYNTSIAMLNTFLSKSVFKSQAGVIKLQVYDLLNQNKNVIRNIADNYIEDVKTNVLTRYFLLSFAYHLNKFAGQGNGMNNSRPPLPWGRGMIQMKNE